MLVVRRLRLSPVKIAMTREEFALMTLEEVVDGSNRCYVDLFSSTALADAKDPYWRRAHLLYSTLSEDQRVVFLSVLRQVSIDSMSLFFSILDGKCSVGGRPGTVDLRLVNPDNAPLDDLQDAFLELVESLDDRPR
jgi:hypothetical protein